MDDILYSLPDDLRDELKEPIGLLVNEEELLRLLAKEEHIVSVGDQVVFQQPLMGLKLSSFHLLLQEFVYLPLLLVLL